MIDEGMTSTNAPSRVVTYASCPASHKWQVFEVKLVTNQSQVGQARVAGVERAWWGRRACVHVPVRPLWLGLSAPSARTGNGKDPVADRPKRALDLNRRLRRALF